MARLLIAYSTIDGQTLRICQRLRQLLERAGHAVVLTEIVTGAEVVDLAFFDAVVVGASIRYGKYRPAVFDFVARRRAALARLPGAFFSVNVVARKPGRDTPEANPYVRPFLRRTAWAPDVVTVFAGRLDYPRCRFLDRQMIRLIMWLTRGPTDPTGCFEFTDWQAVDRFARQLDALAAKHPAILATQEG